MWEPKGLDGGGSLGASWRGFGVGEVGGVGGGGLGKLGGLGGGLGKRISEWTSLGGNCPNYA